MHRLATINDLFTIQEIESTVRIQPVGPVGADGRLSDWRNPSQSGHVKYKRIKSRRGPMKALVEVEHSILIASWHMLTNSELYTDPGPDYFVKRRPTQTQAQARARAIHQLESLGCTATLEPLKMAR